MDVINFHPDEVDSSSANIIDKGSAALHSETGPSEAELSGVLENNAPVVEVEKASQLNQATKPNGGWKAWLQVACGFFLYFNTYGATAVSSISIRPGLLKVADLHSIDRSHQYFWNLPELLHE